MLKGLFFTLCILASAICLAQAGFDAEVEKIQDERNRGEITNLQAEKEIRASVIRNFPNDKRLLLLHDSLVTYAEQFERGAISIERYDEKRIASIQRFEDSRKEMAEFNSNIDTTETVSASTSTNSHFWANMLRALAAGAAGYSRSVQQGPLTCTYVATGNVMTRQCY